MKRAICLILILMIFPSGLCLATTADQILRMQEMLDKEREFRERTEEERNYIEQIIVQGSDVLPEEEILKIIKPYEDRFISRLEVEQLIAQIKKAYERYGLSESMVEISHSIQQEKLIIGIKEKAGVEALEY